jgi:uncharacterized protein
MEAYIDSSVLLRVLLGEPGRLGVWSSITNAVSSELIRLECLRTIDRARIRMALDDRDVARHRSDILEACEAFTLIPVDPVVLDRASRPFPTLVGSLDAIHLASALLARERIDGLAMVTHDMELATAARAEGFPVYGATGAGGR